MRLTASSRAAVALVATLLASGAGGTPPPRGGTQPGDLTVVQVVLRLDAAHPARLARIRRRLARPRPVPRALRRVVSGAVAVVGGVGELAPAAAGGDVLVVASVALVNRGSVAADDVDDRFARTALRLFTGVDLAHPPRALRDRLDVARAPNLRSTPPPSAFCTTGVVTPTAGDSPLDLLIVSGVTLAPWTPRQLLRDALAVAARACGAPPPTFPPPEEVDRFLREFVALTSPTTTLAPSCDGTAVSAPMVLADPAYPACADVEWVTPIPSCASDVAIVLMDATTGEPVGPLLFGHTTQVAYFFGADPVRLVLHACNGAPGSPGGDTITLEAAITWGG